jgi:hypothetical protein
MSKCNDYFDLTSFCNRHRIYFLTKFSPEIVKRQKNVIIVTDFLNFALFYYLFQQVFYRGNGGFAAILFAQVN